MSQTPMAYRRSQKWRALLYAVITGDLQPWRYDREMHRRMRAAHRLLHTH